MTAFPASNHAQSRMQQRAVSAEMIDYLVDFGRCEHHQNGGAMFYFDKRARQHLRQEAEKGFYRRIDRALNAYVVLSGDGKVVTVGHRYRRIKRH